MITMRSGYKRAAALVVERLLALLAIPLRLRASGTVRGLPSRILVVRCDHIGDAVMATPALRNLRNAFPDATITLLAGPWAADAFRESAFIDNVMVYATPWWCAARGQSRSVQFNAWKQLPSIIRQLRDQQFELAIDLRGDLRQILFFLALPRAARRVSSDRTGGITMLSDYWTHDPSLHEVAKSIAVTSVAIESSGGPGSPPQTVAAGYPPLELPTASLPSEVRAQIGAVRGAGGYVTLALRGNAPNKSWPVMRAVELVQRLREEFGLGTVFVGGPADAGVGEILRAQSSGHALNTAGQCTLAQTVSICAGAEVCIAVDSGPMHLAAASSAPVIALFGPTDPALYKPWTRVAAVAGPMAPCGCTGQRCSRTSANTDGSERDSPCMSAITVDHVMQQLHEILRDRHTVTASRSLS